MKATLLAKGISEAMNCTSFAVGLTILWLPPFVIGQIRGRREPLAATVPPRAHGRDLGR